MRALPRKRVPAAKTPPAPEPPRSHREKGSGRLAIGLTLPLALVGTGLAPLFLGHHERSEIGARLFGAICGAASGCEAMDRSALAEIHGVPLALVGFCFYGALVVLGAAALLEDRPRELLWQAGLAAVGMLADLGLLACSVVAVGAVCSLCAATYAVTAAVLFAAAVALARPSPAGAGTAATASTRFEGGVPTDLANDAFVEVEGHAASGVLVAEKVEFKESIRIGPADRCGPVLRPARPEPDDREGARRFRRGDLHAHRGQGGDRVSLAG